MGIPPKLPEQKQTRELVTHVLKMHTMSWEVCVELRLRGVPLGNKVLTRMTVFGTYKHARAVADDLLELEKIKTEGETHG